jgi:hypothetical protein
MNKISNFQEENSTQSKNQTFLKNFKIPSSREKPKKKKEQDRISFCDNI